MHVSAPFTDWRLLRRFTSDGRRKIK